MKIQADVKNRGSSVRKGERASERRSTTGQKTKEKGELPQILKLIAKR